MAAFFVFFCLLPAVLELLTFAFVTRLSVFKY